MSTGILFYLFPALYVYLKKVPPTNKNYFIIFFFSLKKAHYSIFLSVILYGQWVKKLSGERWAIIKCNEEKIWQMGFVIFKLISFCWILFLGRWKLHYLNIFSLGILQYFIQIYFFSFSTFVLLFSRVFSKKNTLAWKD
jgi:hypothetical protein